MDYLQYFCGECSHFSHNVVGAGQCDRIDVNGEISEHCRACFRFNRTLV